MSRGGTGFWRGDLIRDAGVLRSGCLFMPRHDFNSLFTSFKIVIAPHFDMLVIRNFAFLRERFPFLVFLGNIAEAVAIHILVFRETSWENINCKMTISIWRTYWRQMTSSLVKSTLNSNNLRLLNRGSCFIAGIFLLQYTYSLASSWSHDILKWNCLSPSVMSGQPVTSENLLAKTYQHYVPRKLDGFCTWSDRCLIWSLEF